MKKLKILMVMRHTWGNKMGIPKVFYDFKQEYELMGHEVDTLSHTDLYPKEQNLFDKIVGPIFPELILKYLKKNALKYDIIDANFECIPYPKAAFNFNGVLLFRSHGLPQVYTIYEELPPYKTVLDNHRQKIKFKTRIGNVYRVIQRKVGLKELNDSIKYADIVHVLNRAEYKFLLENGVSDNKLKLIPNGLEDQYIEKASKLSIENKSNTISFLASWTLRKGITELNEILNAIKCKIEVEELHLLGGDQPKDIVLMQFENDNFSMLKITPEFEQAELISLLSTAKVGIFPSYVEGFGLAVVEQLACGIPVVAYRVPGPTEILEELDESLLIESGDIEALTKKVVEILNMSDSDYQELAGRCKERAKVYSMRKVAEQFLELYEKTING